MRRRSPPFLSLSRDTDGILCVFDPAAFEEPACWGVVLAEVVEHIASGYEKKGASRLFARSRILFMLSEELAKPARLAHAVEGEWTPAGFVPLLSGKGEA